MAGKRCLLRWCLWKIRGTCFLLPRPRAIFRRRDALLLPENLIVLANEQNQYSMSSKSWLEPQIELAANYGFGSKDLRKRTELVEKCEDDFKQQFAAHICSVLMIDAQGMMLSVLGQDSFVSYNRVPKLRDARVSSALNVRMAGPNAIEWPELDVDLEIESLKHPERYPSVMTRSPLDVI